MKKVILAIALALGVMSCAQEGTSTSQTTDLTTRVASGPLDSILPGEWLYTSYRVYDANGALVNETLQDIACTAIYTFQPFTGNVTIDYFEQDCITPITNTFSYTTRGDEVTWGVSGYHTYQVKRLSNNVYGWAHEVYPNGTWSMKVVEKQ